ncbi:tRNA (guanosine(46)-N7)-methyltransferase TrmB [Alkalihalobacillus hemicellulosilyticus]|uniref:tRNA (guanine-N(7)-)-methyltransferase n=1 Tax=Halalkalibacter hemicellulosilyticusJCM 9152 TaxID=1236971 RepID=W4QKE2_9BACI|nr:tRNA (guanosine(46)-N7)-methyltransferase TrmB [Halalkalibacter hemicellulosilyticus]GAE32377.1 tRNA (guanine46-N7-)-methyltransferase [Halalkalibacter hemicellulosilyticusJCM 9152]
MRLRNKPWAKEELAKYPEIVVQRPDLHKGKWQELFGNCHPIHIEVGTGKGQFLTGMAQQYPNVNFIGIEKYETVLLTALERAKSLKLPNLRFLNEDVIDLLQFFETDDLSRVYINFTDPWPKNRHEKRRLTYKDFLALYEQLLKSDGEIHFKTDNQGLFEYSLESFSRFGLIIKNVSLNLHKSQFEGNIMTEYEEKFSKKGMRIYRCEASFKEK